MTDWLECKVKVSDEVLAQEVNEETVLLDLKSECYFGLDPVGTRCWQLLGTEPGVRDVYEVLLDEYEVESTQLRNDLNALLDQLLEAGLIEQQAPTPAGAG